MSFFRDKSEENIDRRIQHAADTPTERFKQFAPQPKRISDEYARASEKWAEMEQQLTDMHQTLMSEQSRRSLVESANEVLKEELNIVKMQRDEFEKVIIETLAEFNIAGNVIRISTAKLRAFNISTVERSAAALETSVNIEEEFERMVGEIKPSTT